MRDRREIRRKLRDAVQRAKEPAPAAPAGPVEFACLCGQLLRMSPRIEKKRCACPACGRKFLLTFAPDRTSGRPVACPIYVEDTAVTGETLIPEAPGAPGPSRGKGGLDDGLGPEPPAALAVPCPGCTKRMRVKQEFYDKRARCPDCGVRMLLTLVYEPLIRAHKIEPIRVSDAPSGDTKIW